MIDFSKYLDPYERCARLYPGLICLFPIILGTYSAFPEVYKTLSGFVTLAAAIGLLHFFSNIARGLGKKLEPQLFSDWGGVPSVALFRHAETRIAGPMKERYHAILAERTGIQAPSVDEENTDSSAADAVYKSWSDYLRSQTRDAKRYPMVFNENVNYGFRRNLLGLKGYCLLFGLISMAMISVPAYLSNSLSKEQVAFLVVLAIYIFIVATVVNRAWVKFTAYAYAHHLLESVDS
jgi:hypothetical protein